MKPVTKYRIYLSLLRKLRELEDYYEKRGEKIDEEVSDCLNDFLCDRMDPLWWEMTDEEQEEMAQEANKKYKKRGTVNVVEWDKYLKERLEEGTFTEKQVEVAKTFQDLFSQELLPPTTAPFDDRLMCLYWDRNEHHFNLDIEKDGKFEWFYLNRETDFTAGSEDEVLDLGCVPLECMKYFIRTVFSPTIYDNVETKVYTNVQVLTEKS